jgi:oxygen-independent coproporphyrinogen-3 oxidase
MLWRYHKLFIPAFFVCLIAIGTVSKLPDVDFHLRLFAGQDKLFHFIEYAILAVTGNIAFRFIPRRRRKLFLFALLFIAADELLQAFIPGRDPEFLDAAADLAPFILLYAIPFPVSYKRADVSGYEESKAFELLRSVIPGKVFTHGQKGGEISVRITEKKITFLYFGKKLFTRPVDESRPDKGHLIKREIYDAFTLIHDRPLSPWGLLFQTRPHKVMHYLPEEGAYRSLQDLFRVRKDKIGLLEQVWETEKRIAPRVEGTNALYIGIPFCPSKCAYCSFTSYSKEKFNRYYTPFVEALCGEMEGRIPALTAPVSMIYMGGGTPFTLEDGDMDRILHLLTKAVSTSSLLEFTVEAGRPELFTRYKCEMLRQYGVNRIAVNPQTIHQATLERLGRHATRDDFMKAYAIAYEAGFEIINTDIIFGLPGESFAHHKATLKALLDLDGVNNITIHALAPKRGSRLDVEEIEKRPDLEKSFEFAHRILGRYGFSPYYLYKQRHIAGNLENIGYAKEGKESPYNVAMIGELCHIAGFGVGASTKVKNGYGIETRKNPKDLALYIETMRNLYGTAH